MKLFNRPFDIPTLDEALPALVPERQLYERVQAEAKQLKIEIAAERELYRQGIAPDGQNERVAEILSGVVSPKPPIDYSLEKKFRRLTDLNAAIQSQHAKIRSMEREASNVACEKMRGEHNRLAGDLCSTLIESHGAYTNYIRLLDAITDKGIRTTSLQPLTSRILEHPRDKSSGLAYLLREAAANSFIDAKQIPEAIRQ
jgi:hypothetical protein